MRKTPVSALKAAHKTPVSACDCNLEERLNEISFSNARERGFIEIEVVHFPEYRSVFYTCTRCGKHFEGFFEGGEYHFIPVLGGL